MISRSRTFHRRASGVLLQALVIAQVWVGATATASELGRAVSGYRAANERAILRELSSLVALPNRATDDAEIRSNAAFLVAMLERRGIAARLLEPPVGPPAVFGELAAPGATRTVVFYAHYDGQPVNPESWATPPYAAVLRDASLEAGGRILDPAELTPPLDPEWRLYGRSASDDKSPIVAILTALDALRAAEVEPSINLKFFFEGEEEAGSPNLAGQLAAHTDALAADLWLFCDGPVHQSGRQQVVFGVRGVVGLELTLYGPLRPLHSGHYGNWAPNPAAELAGLVAGMRDDQGRILIDGFYDSVASLSEAVERALAGMPDPDSELRHGFALGRTEGGRRLAESILAPALNVRGLRAGEVAELAKNAVPTEARVSIDFRLVPDQTPAEVRRLTEDHLRRRGYTLVTDEPDAELRRATPRLVRLTWEEGYPALWTDPGLPVSRAVVAAVTEALGEGPIEVPSLGGSLPLDRFRQVLGAPLIVVPMVNHDNNQHAPNENLRLGNPWRGIEVYAHLMVRLDELWPPDHAEGE
jgi:acetylornithine deacetylase/succinyl-diaminopimelate desuccinylase-like protein